MKKLLISVAAVAFLVGCHSSKWVQGVSEEVYVDDKAADVTWVLTGENQYDLMVKTWYFVKLLDPLYERDRGVRASGMVVGRLCGAAREPKLIEDSQMGDPVDNRRVYRYKCVLPNATTASPANAPSQPINVTVNANPNITVNSPAPIILDPLGVATAKPGTVEAGPPSGQKSEAPKAQ